ncbi:ABC transporter ATP-binding protein [Deinococcus piscis]|uniref:ABC transporter ATP-binding protein n=1 Tax=Deinococcus piscis TaxID=394230 RepID=A0ABQ3K8R4_9DEIO|nr:ATP-binding cassette domain-containing protein [Deinococcus piscis]GHG02911.1 ABC transporter ATP-binding protein [Deinococcus piscis]
MSGHSPATPPVWQLDFTAALGRGPGRFELHVNRQLSSRRTALVGPSGSGKSLFLQTLAGLVRAERGRVMFGAEPLQDTARGLWVPPQQRGLGYMFQDYALFPHLTVAQNLAAGRRRGWLNPPRRRHDPEVEAWLDRLGLRDTAGLYPHQISGGQAQRTALGRTLLARPRALLLDEPFSALDPALRRELGSELLALLDSLDLPVILVTHDHAEAERLMDEVVTL